MNDYLDEDILSLNIVSAGAPLTSQEILVNYGNYYKPSVNLNGTISWEFVQGNLDNIPAIAPANIKGPGIVILGIEATTGALPSDATIGDCYGVGSSAPYTYYIYNGTVWQSHGQLVGAYFTPTIDASGNLSWSNNAGLTNPTAKNITGPQGLAATIIINEITALAPGSTPTIENVGTIYEAIYNIGLPQGIQGVKGDTGAGAPLGGTLGQILAKKSATNYDTEWINPPQSLPIGGTTDQILAKNTGSNYDVKWIDAPSTLPTGGAVGDILSKNSATDFDSIWKKSVYTKTFVATTSDWTAISGGYSITIAAATHGMGVDIIARVYLLSDTDYIDSHQNYVSNDWKITINATGDIVLTTTEMFAGKLVVK